jgi:hypothetical protein
MLPAESSVTPPQSGSSVTLEVHKRPSDPQRAFEILGYTIGAESILYDTAAHSVVITFREPTVPYDNLGLFLKPSLGRSSDEPDEQSDNKTQIKPDLPSETWGWYAGNVCSFRTGTDNIGCESHCFIRVLKGS